MTNLERRVQRIEAAEQAESAPGHTEIILSGPTTSRAEVDARIRAAKSTGRRFIVVRHLVPDPDPPQDDV